MALVTQLMAQPTRASTITFVCVVGFLLLLLTLRRTAAGSFDVSVRGSLSSSRRLSAARLQSVESIQNATLGFEKILAINLPERTDHRDGLTLAAAVSNLHIEFVDGVHGDTVTDRVLPPHHRENPDAGLRGSWRAHVNAIRSVVENNWTSALIFEDDVDWDVRFRSTLTDVALASDVVLSSSEAAVLRFREIGFARTPPSSPYGDGWDVLWLGHCGMEIPDSSAVVVVENDETAPEARFVHSWNSEEVSPISRFPPHSRTVAEQKGGVCSLAYAVSQKGARHLLNSIGLTRLNNPFDVMLREFCEGLQGDDPHRCIAVLPPLFASHRPAGSWSGDSDINPPGDDGWRDKGFTQNIRWSVRMNMNKILRGDTNYDDQFPDSS